jgi:hypothetical protein
VHNLWQAAAAALAAEEVTPLAATVAMRASLLQVYLIELTIRKRCTSKNSGKASMSLRGAPALMHFMKIYSGSRAVTSFCCRALCGPQALGSYFRLQMFGSILKESVLRSSPCYR